MRKALSENYGTKKFAVKPEKNARKENRTREIIKINCVSLFLRESCCVFGMKVRPFQQTGTRKCFISFLHILIFNLTKLNFCDGGTQAGKNFSDVEVKVLWGKSLLLALKCIICNIFLLRAL